MGQLRVHDIDQIAPKFGPDFRMKNDIVPGTVVCSAYYGATSGICVSRRKVFNDAPEQCEVLWSTAPPPGGTYDSHHRIDLDHKKISIIAKSRQLGELMLRAEKDARIEQEFQLGERGAGQKLREEDPDVREVEYTYHLDTGEADIKIVRYSVEALDSGGRRFYEEEKRKHYR